MRPLESACLPQDSCIDGILTPRIALAGDAGTDRREAARQLDIQLQAELAEWQARLRSVAYGRAWLEGRIAFSQPQERAELEARKAGLDREAREAHDAILARQ
jgi:hypothetical protein